jgi:biopolymer transport protein ExbD
MAKQRKKAPVQEGVDVDLTPMIDVVFLLIIFFLVVTQITTQENVNLRLPDALAANPEDPDEKATFTVHIAPADQLTTSDRPETFGYFAQGRPTTWSLDELRIILRDVAEIVDPDRDYTGRDPETGISENEVVIRSDARAPAAYFGRLIEMMAEPEIFMYRIRIAIMKDQLTD